MVSEGCTCDWINGVRYRDPSILTEGEGEVVDWWLRTSSTKVIKVGQRTPFRKACLHKGELERASITHLPMSSLDLSYLATHWKVFVNEQ